jgi:hypothetical protein
MNIAHRRQEDCEFKAYLGYKVRHCLRKKGHMYYYSLDLECSPKGTKGWPPACGATGRWWIFRRWGLVEGS